MAPSFRRTVLALCVSLALVLSACSSDGASETSAGAPDFSAAQLGGGEFASSSVEGQDTVYWFWAPWCTICRGEAPDVAAVAAEFDGTVDVIGVAGRGEVPEMEDFVSDTGTGAMTHVVDDDGLIWSSFEVVAQPAYAFVDDSGEVEVVAGAMGEDGLRSRIEELATA